MNEQVKNDIRDALLKVNLFACLNDEYIDLLISKGNIRPYKKGENIVKQDDDGDSLFVILEGAAKVSKAKITDSGEYDDKEIVLKILVEGQYFGELSLLDDGPRSASVVATKDTKTFKISKTVFEEVVLDNKEATRQLIRDLVKRFRESDSRAFDFAFLNVSERIVNLLKKIATPIKGAGKMAIEKITQDDIASRVGATREMVNKVLKKMDSKGYITKGKDKKIIIEKDLSNASIRNINRG